MKYTCPGCGNKHGRNDRCQSVAPKISRNRAQARNDEQYAFEYEYAPDDYD